MFRLGALPRIAGCLSALSLLLVLATACGTEPETEAPPPPSDSVRSVVDSAPPPGQRCRQTDDSTVGKVVVTTADGVRLVGAEWGAGPRGVVLLHQRGSNLCGWWDYATELAEAGFHVLAIDYRNSAFSERGEPDLTRDALAAVEWLRAAGAARVVLMGASLGAATALVTVGRHPDAVAGLVALSLPPDIDVTGGDPTPPTTPEAAAPLITVPLLMAWASADPSAMDPAPLIEAAPSPDEQVITRDGSAHGWELLTDGPADIRPEVLAFLHEHTAAG